MRRLEEVVSLVPDLVREDLDCWIEDALVLPDEESGSTLLNDTQFARVQLICTLRYDLDVTEEILPIVLDLLDQLHDTRHRLHQLSQAVLTQNEEVRSSILELLSETKLNQEN